MIHNSHRKVFYTGKLHIILHNIILRNRALHHACEKPQQHAT